MINALEVIALLSLSGISVAINAYGLWKLYKKSETNNLECK